MSNYNFNYAFNISGNCNAVVAEISGGVENLQRNLRATTSLWDTFEGKMLALNQFTQYVGNLSQSLNETLSPGAALNASLAELQAISGAAGEELAIVEKYARSSAKEFGISAAGSVESYKLLLSQLSPELTKNGEALNHMGENVATLSKMMKGDATAAAEVLTTAMNQYGVSLDDPLAASDRMWEMMNTMAAAAREGSAELPAIKVALEQCGMAAKAAGVSFEETNASIQVLDKAGKKGSEGGVALRNVMSTLAQGNPAAAMAPVQGVPKVQQWTEAITGTTTAIDQSRIIMDTYNERLARVQAKFSDIKISIFNSCGDLGIWTQVVAGALVPLSQLVPLIYGAAKAVMFLRSVNFKGAFTGVVSSIRNVVAGLMMQNIAITASGGYWLAFKVLAQNVCRSIGVAIMNIPIVGWIAAAIAAVIAIIQQLWDKCYGFRVAVFTAWEGIKALFSALWEWLSGLWQRISAFFVGLWNGIKSMAQKVANVFMAVVNKIRSFIAAIRNFVVKVVNAVVEKVSAICKPLVTAFKNVANAIKGFFGKIIDWVRDKFYALINWFIDKYNWIASKLNFDKIARLGREAADRSWAADHPEQPDDDSSGGGNGSSDPVGNGGGLGGGSPIGNALGSVGGSASKETDRVKNINITIDRLIDKFTITTNNLSESKERIKDAVAEALLSAVNDANYAL